MRRYEETVAWLLGLEATRGWDLKLERVRAALDALGSPERCYPCLLVAGTNGKGSTVAMLHHMVLAAGRRAGLYTSPHLVNLTERIRVDGTEISREEVVSGTARIRSCMESRALPLTFFEVTTVLAFLQFAERAVDLAILEVGLGGRLDATNVCEPVVSAVTSIGFDHQEFLGSSLDAIAREKAGVMRAGRPVILGPDLPVEAHVALLDEAARIGARPVQASMVAVSGQRVGLRGAHMRRNAAVAAAVAQELSLALPGLGLAGTAVAAGLAEASWPGRLSLIDLDPPILCDGAHNLEAARALVDTLRADRPGESRRLLFGALRDKPWREIAALLAPLATEAVVVAIGGSRGEATSELCAHLATLLPTREAAGAGEALALLRSEDRSVPILATGSLYLVGEVYRDVLARRGQRSVFDLDGSW